MTRVPTSEVTATRSTARLVLARGFQIGLDWVVLAAGYGGAFALRFEGFLPAEMRTRLISTWPYVVLMEYAILFAIGVPRYVWRYVGLREASRILLATFTAAAVLAGVRAFAPYASARVQAYALIPYGVIALNFLLAFMLVAGVRAMRRLLVERGRVVRVRQVTRRPVRTILIGAGQGGLAVAKEVALRPELGILPVGFLDDDPGKRGSVLYGIPVLGPIRSLAEYAADKRAEQALITVSNARGQVVRQIAQACADANLEAKIVPGLHELVGGALNLAAMRDVAIEDVLRRDPVALDLEAIASRVKGRVVLVTGAGGSIGAELCRQLCRFAPVRLVLCERTENALFEIHRELLLSFGNVELEPCIADVTDAARIEQILLQYRPQMILHAAAHKHVPMMERNPLEAIKNNVFGTRTLADLAVRSGVESFVLISTDKAVRPSSIMGATKRAAELYVQALAKRGSTRFVTVRFGNVLGSAGSVVPIFKQQIAVGGPVTVTHPEMKRYFMTIPEAAQLVLQAESMGEGGEIFILDMGEPVKIVDLARDLIRLSGFSEHEIEIRFTGIRPGEKLFEELSTDAESAQKTRHSKIFVGRGSEAGDVDLEASLERLASAVTHGSVAAALESLEGLTGLRQGKSGAPGAMHDAGQLARAGVMSLATHAGMEGR